MILKFDFHVLLLDVMHEYLRVLFSESFVGIRSHSFKLSARGLETLLFFGIPSN
jgi:hypothetical protein